MDREAFQATFHGVQRIGHDLVTKPSPPHHWHAGTFMSVHVIKSIFSTIRPSTRL